MSKITLTEFEYELLKLFQQLTPQEKAAVLASAEGLRNRDE